jgi:hypothetical protein
MFFTWIVFHVTFWFCAPGCLQNFRVAYSLAGRMPSTAVCREAQKSASWVSLRMRRTTPRGETERDIDRAKIPGRFPEGSVMLLGTTLSRDLHV